MREFAVRGFAVMGWVRLTLLVGATFLVVALAAAPAGAQSLDGVTLTISPDDAPVVLGDNVDIQVTVVNGGDEPTPAAVVHIDVTDPASESSVDPEDWTSSLSKAVGVIGPGESRTVAWNIQPISGGTFSLYAVVLSPDSATVASSDVLTVSVEDQRSLNPGGILPVAIGAPLVVGALLVAQNRMARRPPRRQRLGPRMTLPN